MKKADLVKELERRWVEHIDAMDANIEKQKKYNRFESMFDLEMYYECEIEISREASLACEAAEILAFINDTGFDYENDRLYEKYNKYSKED